MSSAAGGACATSNHSRGVRGERAASPGGLILRRLSLVPGGLFRFDNNNFVFSRNHHGAPFRGAGEERTSTPLAFGEDSPHLWLE